MPIGKCPMCSQNVDLPASCARYWCEWYTRKDGRQVYLFKVSRDEYEDETGAKFRTGPHVESAFNSVLKALDAKPLP